MNIMTDKKMNKKVFEQLKKRVGKLWKKFFNKFDSEIKIKKSSNIKDSILEILMKALPNYKSEKDESTKLKIISKLKKDLIILIWSKEDQMNKIIWESLEEVFKSVNDVLENSINDRQIQIWLTQLMTTYSNILNTNKLKMDNKEFINQTVNIIQEKLDNIWKFWIYDWSKKDYFKDILIIIIYSIKVNRFEEEWWLEIVQDLMKDNIERYSSFIPQGMLIVWLEMLANDEDINIEKYEWIIKEVKQLTKD